MKRKLLVVGVISIFGMYMLSFSGSRPEDLGVVGGQLLPLPESPNAVSSQTDDPERKLAAISFDGDSSEMLKKIKALLAELPRTQIISETENYIHAEFRSMIFRFVDDVEFFIDKESKQVHFRSASRVGHSDLGANRNRMQNIISKLSE